MIRTFRFPEILYFLQALFIVLKGLQDLPAEIKLLIGEKIPACQEFLRIFDRGDQVILRPETLPDIFPDIVLQGRPAQRPGQLVDAAFPQKAAVITVVQGICLHHVGIGQDRPGNMREIIPVLLQLFPDPLLLDSFAL